MDSSSSNSQASGHVQRANFGSVRPEDARAVDISKILSEWLMGVLKEIEEKKPKEEGVGDYKHEQYHLDFPPSLPSPVRKSVHHCANSLKLRSSSTGPPDARVLRVSLVDFSTLSPTVLEMVDSVALETAINHRELKRHSKVPHGMSLILDFLYLGSGKDAQDKDTLKAVGVTTVLNATAEWRTSHHNDFEHHRIELKDNVGQALDGAMDRACNIINRVKNAEPPGKILVHCVMGRSRSAAIVMAYLVRNENMSLKDAFELTHKARPIVRPNSRFLSDLIAWEMQHRGTATQQLATWIDVVGIHGSQLQAERKKKLPPPLNISKEDARLLVAEALGSHFTEELYKSLIEKSCNGLYTTNLMPKFMDAVKNAILENPELEQKITVTGTPMGDAIKTAHTSARTWFLERATKVARPPKKKDVEARSSEAPSADQSESSSSAPSE